MPTRKDITTANKIINSAFTQLDYNHDKPAPERHFFLSFIDVHRQSIFVLGCCNKTNIIIIIVNGSRNFNVIYYNMFIGQVDQEKKEKKRRRKWRRRRFSRGRY